MTRPFAIVSAFLVILAASACASAGGGSGSPPPAAKTNANLITSTEISAGDFRNLYDVVQRLRPTWLTKGTNAAKSKTMGGVAVSGGAGVQSGGGSGLLFYLDNTRMGGIGALRDVTPGGIQSLEFMDAATAQARLPGIGSSVITGAIVARSRVGR